MSSAVTFLFTDLEGSDRDRSFADYIQNRSQIAQQATVDDVRAVARRAFTPNRFVEVFLVPE